MAIKKGRILNKEWNVEARQALYSITGNVYNQLDKFPGALFDDHGYVLFLTKQDYEKCQYLNRKKKLNVPGGISSIPGYKKVNINSQKLFPTDLNESKIKRHQYYEGAIKKISVNAYERDPKARNECINHYGYNCQICDMNFLNTYGDVGVGFIHVHHLIPLQKVGKEYQVDPVKDLRPVCPNCHNMIHKKDPPYSIDELKNFLK